MPQKKTAQNRKSKRDLSLDFLRGLAVILMILTHVNGIFYDGEFIILRFFTWWGATVCFTIFLFVSASVNGMSIELDRINKRKMAGRLLKFLLAYYITALLLVALRFGLAESIGNVWKVLTFYYVPEFIEFIIAFILYGFLIVLIPKRLLKYFTQAKFLIPITIGVFIVSKLIYSINTDWDFLITIKFLLTGHLELHAFGILAYFPIFALGLWWGANKIRKPKEQKDTNVKLLIGSFTLYLILLISGLSVGNRWPPSLTFMLYGVWFSFAVLLVADKLIKIPYFGSFVIFNGKNAFNYFIVHIILLYIIAYLVGWEQFSAFWTLIIMIFAFIGTTGAVYLEKELNKGISR